MAEEEVVMAGGVVVMERPFGDEAEEGEARDWRWMVTGEREVLLLVGVERGV